MFCASDERHRSTNLNVFSEAALVRSIFENVTSFYFAAAATHTHTLTHSTLNNFGKRQTNNLTFLLFSSIQHMYIHCESAQLLCVYVDYGSATMIKISLM